MRRLGRIVTLRRGSRIELPIGGPTYPKCEAVTGESRRMTSQDLRTECLLTGFVRSARIRAGGNSVRALAMHVVISVLKTTRIVHRFGFWERGSR